MTVDDRLYHWMLIALIEARKLKDRTVFIDFQTDPTENVFPMVQAGKGITEMLLGSEDL